MRKLLTLSSLLILTAPALAETPQSAPLLQLAKVEFVQEIDAPGSIRLLGQDGDHLFLAREDGSIKVVSTKKGEPGFTIAAKGHNKDEIYLKHPEAVVVANDTIYVVDSELNHVAMFTAAGKYNGSFGSKGSDAGELDSPRGIAFHDGIIYVADSDNERIQLFGDNGVFLNALEIDSAPGNKSAEEQKLPYKLTGPVSVAVDPAGRMIYILDREGSLFSSSYSIKIYGMDGTFIKQLQNGVRPVAIAAVPDGIYVADEDNYAIQKYDLNGKLVSSFGSKGSGRAQFKSLAGLTAEDGQVYVGDRERSAILDFRPDASALPAAPAPREAARPFVRWTASIPANITRMVWDRKDTLYGINRDDGTIVRIRNGKVEGEVKIKAKDVKPVALTIGKDGALWILDKNRSQVLKLDDSGTPVVSFGSSGSRNGQFDDPSDIAISDSGIIFVADPGNHRIQAFSDDGVFLSDFSKGISGRLDDPSAIAIGPSDNLYVLDAGRSTVTVYSPKGEAVTEFGNNKNDDRHNLRDPRDVMATGNEVFVAEANRVRVFSHEGKYLRSFGAGGKDNGELSGVSAIAIKDPTSFFIAERDGKRIQEFMTLYKPAAPAEVTAQGTAHATTLHWAPSPLPYVAQYEIYRSKDENGTFVRIGTSKTGDFSDEGLPPDEKYFYRVSAESSSGYEGVASPLVSAVSQKYSPPAPEIAQVTPLPTQLKMSWKPLDSRYISTYLLYQKDGNNNYIKVGETVAPEFDKDGLIPGTEYTYYVSARSVDGIESDKTEVHATTTADTSMPLDIAVEQLNDVFSNTYKLYEQDGVGKAKLTNNTANVQKSINVSFVLNNFMDYPTETKINSLAPGESKEVDLKAVFNNNILTLTEDTPVQAKIEASYYVNGQKKTFSTIKTINIYDKHRLMWNEPGRYAAFITPKDPDVLNFTREVASQYPTVKDTAMLAAVLFDSLGALGVTYVQDPTNPYQVTSGKVDTVDYIQYPRETLKRKAGDCDDLTAMYSAALGAYGIPTRVLLVPGHMLMMFSTGVPVTEDGYTMDGMYAIYEGTLWIPVETTLLGKPFAKAWESGAAAYYKWKDKGLTIFDPNIAWATFKPATLPDDNWKPAGADKASIEREFPGDLNSILKISSQTKTRSYLQIIQKDPSNLNALLQVGIIMAKSGDPDEAMKYFGRVIEKDPRNAAALNNQGNLYMLDGRYANAQKSYTEAIKADPLDAEIQVNLAKAYKAEKKMELAKQAFDKAQKIDPSVSSRHKALALELMSTLSAEQHHKKPRTKKPGNGKK